MGAKLKKVNMSDKTMKDCVTNDLVYQHFHLYLRENATVEVPKNPLRKVSQILSQFHETKHVQRLSLDVFQSWGHRFFPLPQRWICVSTLKDSFIKATKIEFSYEFTLCLDLNLSTLSNAWIFSHFSTWFSLFCLFCQMVRKLDFFVAFGRFERFLFPSIDAWKEAASLIYLKFIIPTGSHYIQHVPVPVPQGNWTKYRSSTHFFIHILCQNFHLFFLGLPREMSFSPLIFITLSFFLWRLYSFVF